MAGWIAGQCEATTGNGGRGQRAAGAPCLLSTGAIGRISPDNKALGLQEPSTTVAFGADRLAHFAGRWIGPAGASAAASGRMSQSSRPMPAMNWSPPRRCASAPKQQLLACAGGAADQPGAFGEELTFEPRTIRLRTMYSYQSHDHGRSVRVVALGVWAMAARAPSRGREASRLASAARAAGGRTD